LVRLIPNKYKKSLINVWYTQAYKLIKATTGESYMGEKQRQEIIQISA
jgi:hypothetical protein